MAFGESPLVPMTHKNEGLESQGAQSNGERNLRFSPQNEKENHLNQTFMILDSMLIFQGVLYLKRKEIMSQIFMTLDSMLIS